MDSIRQLVAATETASRDLAELAGKLPDLCKRANAGEKSAALELAAAAMAHPFLVTGLPTKAPTKAADVPPDLMSTFLGSYIAAGLSGVKKSDQISCSDVIRKLWLTGPTAEIREAKLQALVTSRNLTLTGTVHSGKLMLSEVQAIPEAIATDLDPDRTRRAQKLAEIFTAEEAPKLVAVWDAKEKKRRLRDLTDIELITFYGGEFLQNQTGLAAPAAEAEAAVNITKRLAIHEAIATLRTVIPAMKTEPYYRNKPVRLKAAYERMLGQPQSPGTPSSRPQFHSAQVAASIGTQA